MTKTNDQIADSILKQNADAQTLVTFARDLKAVDELNRQIANITSRRGGLKPRLTAALALPVVKSNLGADLASVTAVIAALPEPPAPVAPPAPAR